MLEKDPDKRISAAEALKHKFLEKEDFFCDNELENLDD
jgi:serine/threonine protein kinase